MTNNLIDSVRESCVITNSKDIENLFTLNNFPIFIGNTTQKPEDDLFSDMIFDISKECGAIQLKVLINPNIKFLE